MLCMLSWCADTQQLDNVHILELPTDAFELAEPTEGSYNLSWAPCSSKLAAAAYGSETLQLMVWIVSSQAQVLHCCQLSAAQQVHLIWTRDSTLALLDDLKGVHAVSSTASRSVFGGTLTSSIHTAPFLEGAESMVVLRHGQGLFIIDCSKDWPTTSFMVQQDLGKEPLSVATGCTYLAIIWQQSPACMQLFVMAAGPTFVPTHDIQLPSSMLSGPGIDAQQAPCMAFSPDDSHIAVVHTVSNNSWWAALSVLRTSTGHGEQPYLLQRSSEQQDWLSQAFADGFTWSSSGSSLSVHFPRQSFTSEMYGWFVVDFSGHEG